MHGMFCWNELMTRDADAAKKFYTDLIGWTAEESDMGGMKYTMFKAGDKQAAGLMKIDDHAGDHPTSWMAYIYVDDVDAVSKRAEQLGGQMIVPPTDIPIGRFCLIADPPGAVVGLFTAKEQA